MRDTMMLVIPNVVYFIVSLKLCCIPGIFDTDYPRHRLFSNGSQTLLHVVGLCSYDIYINVLVMQLARHALLIPPFLGRLAAGRFVRETLVKFKTLHVFIIL